VQEHIDALISKHQAWRSEIWLDVNDSIEDLEINNFTLRHLMILDGLNSPFIKGGTINRADALMFLWVVSTGYNFNAKDRDEFFRRASKIPFDRQTRWIKEYLERAFSESDTMQSGKKNQTYFVAYFVDCMAREYGWSIETILSTPLAILFQLITTINERNSAHAGKEYNRVTDLDNQINRYLLNRNSNNGIQ
jgi:hypothetical protein